MSSQEVCVLVVKFVYLWPVTLGRCCIPVPLHELEFDVAVCTCMHECEMPCTSKLLLNTFPSY